MGSHHSTLINEGRKGSSLLAIKMQGTNRSGEGGEEPAMCDPGSELRLLIGGRENRRAEDNK